MLVCGKNEHFLLDKAQSNKNSNGKPIINPPVEFRVDSASILSFSANFQQTVWITHDGKSYVTGDNRNGIISGSLPKEILPIDTEFILKDQNNHPYKFISVVCGVYFTLYLVSDELETNLQLVLCYSNQSQNPLFLNIGQRIPRTLYGGYYISGVIDNDGGVIVLKRPLFENPTQEIESNFLPFGDKAIKIACCYSYFVCLGQSGKIYSSRISGSLPAKFEEIKEFSDKKVVDVSSSYDFCFIVLDDGRVFGSGSNWHCKLGLPKEICSVSKFVEIDSLNKYKIVSAYTGTSHSIFKTIEGEMIVCGNNNNGQLFLPPKEIVFPPEEVKICQGFTFCVTGDCSSAAFVGINPPKNISNMIMNEKKDKIINSNKFESISSRREIEELKKKLAKKEEEILLLKKENLELKSMRKKDTDYIEKLENENSELKIKNSS